MTAPAPVLVTEAPRGTAATRVPARTRTDLAVVAVVAPPGRRATTDLPLDLLAELGKRDDVAGRSTHVQLDTALVPLWLAAHRTGWVVVTSPHVLDGPTLQLLATLCLPAGARLLLACDSGTAPVVLDGLADYGAVRVAWDELPALVPPPDPAGGGPTAGPADARWGERSLTLPREDWPRFRPECRRLLHPVTFARVDATYTTAFRTARAWLASNDPDEDTVAALVARTIGAGGDADQAVAALRGCQAAHADAGWALRADLGKVLAAVSDRPAELTDTEWRSLRAYRDPHRAAAVALHQHGLTPAAMHALTVGSTAEDGSDADGTTVDPRGRAYVRAQRLHRAADGAGPEDPLLVDEPRRTVNALRDARADLGLRLGEGRLSEDEHPADRWQRRLGLQLCKVR